MNKITREMKPGKVKVGPGPATTNTPARTRSSVMHLGVAAVVHSDKARKHVEHISRYSGLRVEGQANDY